MAEKESSPKPAHLRVRGVHEEGMRTQIQVRKFTFKVDEPTELGGSDAAPNPMEYVLGGLIGCANVMLYLVAEEVGLLYSDAEYEVKGVIDLRGLQGVSDVCRHFTEVSGTIYVGTNDKTKLAEVARQIESRCPVFNLLKDAGTKVAIEWKAR